MSYKESESFIATPPGELLKELMLSHNISVGEMSATLEISKSELCNLLEGDIPLTPEIAETLGRYFSFPPEVWLNWEKGYREDLDMVNQENAVLVLETA